MLSAKDILKLAKVLANKEDVAEIRVELKEVKNSLGMLWSTVDGLSKKVDVISDENTVIKKHLRLI